jgi:hypothetical protein
VREVIEERVGREGKQRRIDNDRHDCCDVDD